MQDTRRTLNGAQRRVADLPVESQAFLRGLAELIARDILRQHGYPVPDGGTVPMETEPESRLRRGGAPC